MSIFRAEKVVPLIVVVGAIALAASEFMIAFEFTPPGGEALREVSGGDRHGFSNVILAFAAITVMVIAIATGSQPAAYAVAALGVVALLLFLVVDLPDVGQRGNLRDPLRDLATAEAVPQNGFWMQAIGAVALAVGGGLFAAVYAGRWSEDAESGATSPRRERDRGASNRRAGGGGTRDGGRERAGEDSDELPFDQESSPTR